MLSLNIKPLVRAGFRLPFVIYGRGEKDTFWNVPLAASEEDDEDIEDLGSAAARCYLNSLSHGEVSLPWIVMSMLGAPVHEDSRDWTIRERQIFHFFKEVEKVTWEGARSSPQFRDTDSNIFSSQYYKTVRDIRAKSKRVKSEGTEGAIFRPDDIAKRLYFDMEADIKDLPRALLAASILLDSQEDKGASSAVSESIAWTLGRAREIANRIRETYYRGWDAVIGKAAALDDGAATDYRASTD
jgi:hypothetical protein